MERRAEVRMRKEENKKRREEWTKGGREEREKEERKREREMCKASKGDKGYGKTKVHETWSKR